MKRRLGRGLGLGIVAPLSIIVSGAVACSSPAPHDTSTTSDDLKAGSNPYGPDYVRTPGGYWHKSCVHEIPADSSVKERTSAKESVVTLRDGTTQTHAPCAYPHYPSRPRKQSGSSGARAGAEIPLDAPVPTTNGWVQASWWPTGSIVDTMMASFSVPDAPSSYTGQVIFFFPSIETFNYSGIIQPVLQYGVSAAGGGGYWAIASWYVGYSTFYSSLTPVNSGDQLFGYMHMDPSQCFEAECQWQIWTLDQTTNAQTTLNAWILGEATNQIQGGVLEAYNVNNCSQLPGTGWDVFSGIAIWSNSQLLTPTWSLQNYQTQPQCGYSVTSSDPYDVVLNWTGSGSGGGGGGSNFIGCFGDNPTRDLPTQLGLSSNTPAACVAACKQANYAYAGVQYSSQCFCGSSYGAYGTSSNCNMPCSGDGSQTCGGSWANDVYSTGR